MNLPNKLTVFRIFCVPVEAFLILGEISKFRLQVAFGLFLVLALSDFFDGHIARREKIVTVFGKFLDPLADKILTMTVFLCFFELNLIGIIPIIIMVNREFVVTAVRLLAANNGVVISANFFGKLKTFLQMVAIIMMFLVAIYPAELVFLKNIMPFFVDVMVAFSVLSGAIYLCRSHNLLKDLV